MAERRELDDALAFGDLGEHQRLGGLAVGVARALLGGARRRFDGALDVGRRGGRHAIRRGRLSGSLAEHEQRERGRGQSQR